MSTPTPVPVPQINFPKVDKQSVIGFAKAWDFNGIKMILDNTSIKFAEDFANTCLRSYVIDLMNKAAAQRAARQAGQPQANSAAPIQANPVPQKSSIILTDAS